MSWGFGGLSAAIPSGSSAQGNAAPDLESIETEQLAFQALNGERKIRLIPSTWPEEGPSKTASLLSIASGRGLIAAASPDRLVLHSTEAVRAAFLKEGGSNVENVDPRKAVTIPRISHLAFSSDENALVIAAEEGGGLAVYDVSAATDNSEWSAGFQISTDGVAVRQIAPNPNKDSAHLIALVLTDGKLLIADLKSRALSQGSSGNTVLRDKVSCLSWSKMGKQIVAGLADGSAVQLDVTGNEKDVIPRPPSFDSTSQLPVTAIYWLENLDFFLVHGPLGAQNDDADSMLPMSETFYHIVHRDKDTKTCSFHRFSDDPCPPFNDDRLPAHHFLLRLREWQPNLDDTIITACTASTDIGAFTRSRTALSQAMPADKITNTYTTTSFPDTRRAALPMAADGMGDTYPIGVALDLSSRSKVPKPIPNDETLDESSLPVPQLCVLNQEGNLSAWWYIYNEGVRQNVSAPGMIPEGASQTPVSSRPTTSTGTASPFGTAGSNTTQPAFGRPSAPTANPPAFGQASTPSFGQSSFGSPSSTAFGGASALGKSASPWGTANTASTTSSFGKPSFGAPSFGTTSQLGASTASAFGQGGGLGNTKSPWASAAQPADTTSTDNKPVSAFGSGNAAQSPFAAFNKNKTSNASPFAAQAKTAISPFAAFNQQANKPSAFAGSGAKPGMPNETSFGSTVTLSSNTGSFGSNSTFGQPSVLNKASDSNTNGNKDDASTAQGNSAASGAFQGFTLGSTFKGDGSAKDDLPKPKDINKSLFGFGLGDIVEETAKSDTKKEPAIKSEPEEDSGPALEDIPEAAPLPPDFVTAKTQAKADGAEAAPLPPDFLSTKTQAKDDASDTAPLPPDFLPSKSEGSAAPNNAPAQTVEKPTSESVGLPDDDEEDYEDVTGSEGEDDEEEEDDGDHEEIDDGEEDDEEFETEDEEQSPVIVNPKGLSAFESRITPASPKRDNAHDESTTPETVQKPTFTPAGFPKAPLTFSIPSKIEESPRSPSPVRAVTSPLAFGRAPAKQPTASSFLTNPLQVPQQKFKASDSGNKKSHFASSQPPKEPELLEDLEDARIKAILGAPIEPIDTLPNFIAHQNYVPVSEKPGLAGQLEKVYRDVNSMIDTLGLNARSLQAFVAGHTTESAQLDESALADEEAWRLGQLTSLSRLQTAIDDKLDKGKLTDVSAKVDEIMEQDERMSRTLTQAADIRKQLAHRTDPVQLAQHHASALQPETAAQQAELRHSVLHVQKLLSELEQNMSLLRADLASLSAEAGAAVAVPTVEAVTNTILKMTAMIEKKSGDIDVLEAQIRRLPEGIASLGMSANYEDSLANGLAESRLSYSTPPRNKTRGNGDLGMSGMFGSKLRSPPSLAGSFRRSQAFDPSASFMSSVSGSARKKMSDVTNEEVEAWKAKIGRRQKVLSALKQAVESSQQSRTIAVSRS